MTKSTKTKIKVNREYILNSSQITLTKHRVGQTIRKDGSIRKHWTTKDQLYIINNIKKGINFLAEKLNRSNSSIRNKIDDMMPKSCYAAGNTSGSINWNKIHDMEIDKDKFKKPKVIKPIIKNSRGQYSKDCAKLSKEKGISYTEAQKIVSDVYRIKRNEEIKSPMPIDELPSFNTKHQYEMHDASIVDLHRQIDVINHNQEQLSDLVVKNSRVLKNAEDSIKKLDNSIGSVEDNIHEEIIQVYDRLSPNNNSERVFASLSIKIVKGFGFGFGYQNYEDKKFGIILGPFVINIWR